MLPLRNDKIFKNNHSDGGGIKMYDSNVELYDVIIDSNTANYGGGGIYLDNSIAFPQ